jgi:hypothetical protein
MDPAVAFDGVERNMKTSTRTPEQKARQLAWEKDIEQKEAMIADRLVAAPPVGESYEATVPATLDLAERGALALNSLTQMLDRERGHGLYAGTVFGANPAYLFRGGDYLDVPKLAEALPLMRVMSGSQQDLDRERGVMLRLMAASWDDGLIYAPPVGLTALPDSCAEQAHMCLVPRFMLSMLHWYQYDANLLWLEHARKIYRTIRDALVRHDGDIAYIPLSNYPRTGYSPNPPGPDYDNVHLLGCYILGLTRYSQTLDDPEAPALAGKFVKMLRKPRCWHPLDDPVGVVGEEVGHSVRGCETHAYLFALRGLLEYAQATNDAELKGFVRQSYAYWRSFGIPEIGWIAGRPGYSFTETCAIADMVILAVRLSDYGVGDYWEDVDQTVRNQLVEQQFTDQEQLLACAAASFPHQVQLPFESADRAVERSIGSFANIPFVTDYPDPWTGPCCNHNGAQALYQAWEAIVRDEGDGTAQVNLLFNRASPQLDVDSYLPYEGKVILKNKTAGRIHVRIPGWVRKADVHCKVGGVHVTNQWLNNYLILKQIKPGDPISIEFPVVEHTFKRTEGASGVTYSIGMRGNTVIELSPRVELDPMQLSDGGLVVSAPSTVITRQLVVQDVSVSVEATSTADAGIILRYAGPEDYVLAYYCIPKPIIPVGHTLTILEMVGGAFRPPRRQEQIGALESDIRLMAEIEGSRVTCTVTDETRTFSISGVIESNHEAGAVGLYSILGVQDGSDSHGHRHAQRYGDFAARLRDGQTIFADSFEGAEGSKLPDSWEVATLPVNYRFYLRDHLRDDKAPLVARVRFVPDRIITP